MEYDYEETPIMKRNLRGEFCANPRNPLNSSHVVGKVLQEIFRKVYSAGPYELPRLLEALKPTDFPRVRFYDVVPPDASEPARVYVKTTERDAALALQLATRIQALLTGRYYDPEILAAVHKGRGPLEHDLLARTRPASVLPSDLKTLVASKMPPKIVASQNAGGGRAIQPRTLVHGMMEITGCPRSGFPRVLKSNAQVSWWVQVASSTTWADEKRVNGRLVAKVTRSFKFWKRTAPRNGRATWREWPSVCIVKDNKKVSSRWNQVCWNPITEKRGCKLALLAAMVKGDCNSDDDLRDQQGDVWEGDHCRGDYGWVHLDWKLVTLSPPCTRQ